METEIWKVVKGYEGIYEVSSLGNVKSLSRILYNKGKSPFLSKEKIMKPRVGTDGYLALTFYKNKKAKQKVVHKLVAESFLNHIPNGFELVVNHINHIKTDNRVKNLEIVSQRENASKRQYQYTSKYVGVCWNKWAKKWMSSIRFDGNKKTLGYFTDELEASNAYQNELYKINQLRK